MAVLATDTCNWLLTTGALVFLVYVLGRYSARYSESLMNIAFDPTVSDISRLLGKMIGAFKPEDATTGVAVWVSMLNFRSLEYSKAPWAREKSSTPSIH
jgi:hypothetical protein